jgi:hypothetical protein
MMQVAVLAPGFSSGWLLLALMNMPVGTQGKHVYVPHYYTCD